MTDNRQIHDLLTELVDTAPPVDIDVDHQIRRGRRRQLRRRTAALAAAAVAVPAVALGGLHLLQMPNQSTPAPAASTTPDENMRPNRYDALTSTAKSKELLAEVRRLTPELAKQPDKAHNYRPYDYQLTKEGKLDSIHVTLDWTVSGVSQITVAVEIGSGDPIRRTCEPKGPSACTEVRNLPGGAIAYIRSGNVPNNKGHYADVTLERPDGSRINVGNAAYLSPEATVDAPYGVERLLQIAQQITVRP